MFSLASKGSEPGIHSNDPMVIRLPRLNTQLIKAESVEFVRLRVVSVVEHHWPLHGLNVIAARDFETMFEGEVLEDLAALGGYVKQVGQYLIPSEE